MQQINLLQSQLRSTHRRWSVQKAGYLSGAMASLLVIITLIQWGVMDRIENTKEFFQQQQNSILIEIKTISDAISKISDDSILKRTLVDKEKELANKKTFYEGFLVNDMEIRKDSQHTYRGYLVNTLRVYG